MSAFTEPLAQVREGLSNCPKIIGPAEAAIYLAALAQVERLATDMENMIFEHHRSLAAIGGGPCICDICSAVLSAREEGTP